MDADGTRKNDAGGARRSTGPTRGRGHMRPVRRGRPCGGGRLGEPKSLAHPHCNLPRSVRVDLGQTCLGRLGGKLQYAHPVAAV